MQKRLRGQAKELVASHNDTRLTLHARNTFQPQRVQFNSGKQTVLRATV